MKGLLKKSLALALALTMVFGAATLAVTMRQNALAAEETLLDWEIISAQYIAGVRDYPDFAIVEGNTANDIFNYYIKDDVYSPSVEMLNSVRNDNGMKALMTTWQVYSLGGSPSSATKKIMQGEDYCETLLVSTLNMSLKDGIIATVLKSKVLGDTKDLRDMFYDFCDLGDDFDLSKNLGEVSDGLTKAVNKKYKETPDKAKSITGKIGDIIKYSKNITEVIQKVATYSSMLDLDDYSKTWLKQMKNANESSIQDPDMRIALNKLIEASESDSGFTNVALLESGFTGVEWIVQKGISEGIKALCASSSIVSSIFAGLSVSNTICNLFFSTDDVCEQFFVMDKLEKLQELARSVAKDEQTSFVADQNNINAQRFTKSVELYFRSITEVDCDCMKKFVTNLYEGGYLSDTLALLMGASGNYEAHIDALESLRQARISNYNYMIQYCKCGFRLESESSFLYYFPPEDTEIPITGLSLEPLQNIGSYPEGIDLKVGDFITLFPIYMPSNTTQTGVVYSSSDESIVDVGTSGVLFGESAGTATITVTSIYDKNIKTSIDIRVGEKTESSGEPGGIVIPESGFKYTIIDGKVIITGLKNENVKTAKIPSRIEGYPVTSIGDSAFWGCTGLTSVTIPDSVTSIGDYAFRDCTGLTSVIIPDSVARIGDDAFNSCTNLSSITIPNGVTIIGNYAFRDCTGLTSVIIPDSVTSIGDEAFYFCTRLTSVTIGNGVTSIGSSAFYGCEGLTSVTIPDSVARIGVAAFGSCTKLKNISVDINNQYYSSDESGLLLNKDKTVLIQYPAGNERISYTIPDSVTTIGSSAFSGCTGLTSVTIPDSVTSIGTYAFFNCIGLTSVTIPDSVTRIGGGAFYGCTGLTSVSIPDSVTSISDWMFYNCTKLTSVTIPDSVTRIGGWAFYGCTGLTSVIIPDSVTSIGDDAFNSCTNLSSITIGNSVKSIGWNAFEDCAKLTSITIPDSVTSIGGGAFWGCTGLTSVSIPDSVTSIGGWAFYDCAGLTSVSIPDSVTSIGNSAFYGCTRLTDVYYAGTEDEWNAISISQGNDCVKNATIHYNCTPCTHILTHINNNATCTKPGTEYNLCSKCGAKLNFKSIPATGHNWSAWTITTVPTVKADGIEKRICIACGEEEIRIITKLNGVYDDSTGIEVIFESESCSATELRVEKSQSDEVLALIKTVSKNLNTAVYDIATYDNGIKVQPVEKVTVRIPIPNGFNSDMIAVYYVDTESDSLTRIPNRVEYGYVVFETDHFSYYAVVDETVLNLSIKNPSTTTINYGDSIVLHADIDGTLPTGARIEWTASNGNFDMSVSADGTTCKISPKSNGKTVFTATVYGKDGNVISSDTQEMTAKAGLWQKIVAFFKKIFGLTKTFPEAFKGIL